MDETSGTTDPHALVWIAAITSFGALIGVIVTAVFGYLSQRKTRTAITNNHDTHIRDDLDENTGASERALLLILQVNRRLEGFTKKFEKSIESLGDVIHSVLTSFSSVQDLLGELQGDVRQMKGDVQMVEANEARSRQALLMLNQKLETTAQALATHLAESRQMLEEWREAAGEPGPDSGAAVEALLAPTGLMMADPLADDSGAVQPPRRRRPADTVRPPQPPTRRQRRTARVRDEDTEPEEDEPP